jgi:Tfp pilus assembly protein PilZ
VSEFIIPLRRVMLLQKTLEDGGAATCPLRRPETTIDAQIEVENDTRTHHIKVIFGPLTGSITLQRGDSSKYMALRDYLEDLANGRAETGEQSQLAIALMEAQDCINSVIEASQIAYVIPTTTPTRPFGAVVTDDQGEICAAVTGTCKHHLAEALRAKLRPFPEVHGERS